MTIFWGKLEFLSEKEYLVKCQILVDYFNRNPINIEATQEMVDDLVSEGFLGKNGLTKKGKNVAKILDMIFQMSESFLQEYIKEYKKELTKKGKTDSIKV